MIATPYPYIEEPLNLSRKCFVAQQIRNKIGIAIANFCVWSRFLNFFNAKLIITMFILKESQVILLVQHLKHLQFSQEFLRQYLI